MENRFIKSSPKYDGIYHKVLSSGDLTYYIRYKQGRINKTVKIGKKSEGINIAFCHQQRNDIINKAKFGEAAPIIKHKNKSGIAFDDLIDKYIQSKNNSKKQTNAYKAIKNIFGDSHLDEITAETVDKFKSKLIGNNKAPKTVNSYLQRINSLFDFAIDRELFKGLNPCKKIGKLKTDNTRVKFLYTDEITKLKEALKDKPMLLLFVELSLSTGARLLTITSITKKDINLIARTIQLQNHKSKNSYTGFISDSLLPLLEQRYKELKSPNDLLLDTHGRSIQKQLQPRLNKLFNEGLDTRDAKNRVVIHTLRHTFASHLAIKGIPIFTIMKLLDHKDIKDTLRYAKLAPDNGLEAVKELW
ncbi:MAG: tyrosine-type recombinase/integrase, partial [Campylobacteraceae bacterium]|nr:tyrosine-type recombinase/integrase [Campylobacteraceae bacterium]